MQTRSDGLTFEITQEFRRPLADVWQAWTEAASLQKWWGPKGCEIGVGRMELRPGGFFHFSMKFPGGETWWGRFNYREIVEGQRLVWLNSFANEHCGMARAPFAADCPLEIENVVTFGEKDGTTTVKLRATPFGELPAERKFFEELHPSLKEGYGGTFAQLAQFLRG
ncbi:MAG: SRPBCC domain-containing protein [Burkholderiaceae bacterium]